MFLMKKSFFFIITALISFFFFLPNLTLAQESTPSSQKPKIIEVKKGEIINHDFFAGAKDVNILGTVNGDVFVGGNNVLVNGKINGDLIAGSENITFNGEVNGNIRIAGSTVFINGLVGKNLTVVGSNLIIGEKARVNGSLLAFGSDIRVQGPIGKDARIYGSQVVVGSQIGRNLGGSFANLILTSQAKVLGDLEYQSPREAQIDSKAKILGKTIYKPMVHKNFWQKSFVFHRQMVPLFLGLAGFALWLKFMAFLLALGFGFLFLYFFPKRVEGMAKIIGSHFWLSLGVGVLIPIIFSLVVIFLAVSLVGIPFIFIVGPIFFLLVYFAKIFTAFFFGRKILGAKKSWGWALVVGLLIYYFLGMIPIINGLTSFVFITVGLGAFILDQKSLRSVAKIAVKSSKNK